MANTVLICGFGMFGEHHAGAWQRLDSDVVLMVADPAEKALARARQFGVATQYLANDAAILVDRADIVDVVAPPAFHLPLALMAISAGKPVVIEKPAVKTVAEAQQLLDAAGPLPVQIGLVLRAHPLVAEARRLLGAGEIGKLLAMDGDFSGWKRMRADSSMVENDGVHFLDLMRHFAGVPAVEVDARSWSLIDPLVVDDIVIELGFKNGVKSRLRLGVLTTGEMEDNFVPGAMTTKRLTLIGNAGNIVIDFNRNRLVLSKVSYQRSAGGHDVRPQKLSSQTSIGVTPEALLSASFDIFRAAIREQEPVMCDAMQGALEVATTLAAIETALASQNASTYPIHGSHS